jgi:NAD(P)-dependent dehydrogenase (short-subunit alcohol dehydrogenase family)
MMNQETSPFRVDGKVALVTGAARGIGASCARVLAQAGAQVVVTDIDTDVAEGVASDIRESGGDAYSRHLDVASEDQWKAVIEEAVQTFGALDIVVNNAGVEGMSFVEDTALSDWQRVMSVNSDGVFLGVKHGILAMKPGGLSGRGGSIINIASICAMVALQGAGSYSASKAAVTILTKMAAVECGKNGNGIRVNSIHPGVILTELVKTGMEESARQGIFESAAEALALNESMHPIGRLGEPEDIAHVVDGGYIAQ